MTKRKKPAPTARASSTQEFRDTAVQLALSGNKSTAEVARELGIPAWKLYGWVQNADKQNKVGSTAAGSSADDALRQLQKRNKELELEVEILKKAAAYFAKNLP
jgi:transposase